MLPSIISTAVVVDGVDCVDILHVLLVRRTGSPGEEKHFFNVHAPSSPGGSSPAAIPRVWAFKSFGSSFRGWLAQEKRTGNALAELRKIADQVITKMSKKELTEEAGRAWAREQAGMDAN